MRWIKDAITTGALIGSWLLTLPVAVEEGVTAWRGWLSEAAVLYELLGPWSLAIPSSLTVAWLLYYRKRLKGWFQAGSAPTPEPEIDTERAAVTEFDTPIRDAILYLIDNTAHSYTSTHLHLAEWEVFGELHKMMCEDRLKVIGSRGEFGPPSLISPEQCLGLKPKESFLPRSKSAPDGVIYILSPPVDEKNIPKDRAPIRDSGEFRNLRVRSVDLRRIWPE